MNRVLQVLGDIRSEKPLRRGAAYLMRASMKVPSPPVVLPPWWRGTFGSALSGLGVLGAFWKTVAINR
ncbi:MAG: hypothetical protein V9H26_05625 [Verrucomicrobiota bacterium]